MAEKGKKNVATAELKLEDSSYSIDIIEGSEKERALDIRSLRKDTQLITLDPGYVNTGACESAITYIDGAKGILRHRGYAIEDLATHCSFTEVAYLLVHGKLPNQQELDRYSRLLNKHAMIHEGMNTFFHLYPERAHPMAILSAMVVSLSSFYPELHQSGTEIETAVTRLLSKVRTMAAFCYKQSIGEPYVYPSTDYTFCENILNMMFASPVSRFEVTPELAGAMNKLLIIHADHEQNCSTSVVRMVGSSGANLYASVAAGISALWGPLHGGANQAVLEMLEKIRTEGLLVDTVIERAKTKDSGFRLMGFGHRVYKTYDPRSKIAKEACRKVLDKLGKSDALLDIAAELEEKALADSYFQERNLYPNVDYYTGITYRAMGFPSNMFTVLFAIGRLPGWIAHWLELREDPENRIGRPRQIYTGPTEKSFVPIEQRD